jgi:hypothetical protein
VTTEARSEAQYRRMLSQQERALRAVWLYWVVPLVLVGVAAFRSWPVLVDILGACAVVAGIIQHGTTIFRVRDLRNRVHGTTRADALQ